MSSVALKIVKRLYLNNYVETYITSITFGNDNGFGLIEYVKKNIQNKSLQIQFTIASKNFYLDVLFYVWSTGARDRFGALTEDQIFGEMKRTAKQYFNYKFDPDSMYKLFQKAQMFLGQTKFEEAKKRFIEFYNTVMNPGEKGENVEDYKSQRAAKNSIKSQILNPSGGLSQAKKQELESITEAIVTRRQSVGVGIGTPRENEITSLDPLEEQNASKLTTGVFKSSNIDYLWNEVLKRKETYENEGVQPEEDYIYMIYSLMDVYNSYTKQKKLILPVNNFGYTYDKANKVYVINLKDPGGIYLLDKINYLTIKGLGPSQINLSVVCSESSFTKRHKQHYYDTVFRDAGGAEAAGSEPIKSMSESIRELAEAEQVKKEIAKIEKNIKNYKDAVEKAEKISQINNLKDDYAKLLKDISKLSEAARIKLSDEMDKIQIQLNDKELDLLEKFSKPPVTPDRVPSNVDGTPTKIVEMKANDEQHDIAEMKHRIDNFIAEGEKIVKLITANNGITNEIQKRITGFKSGLKNVNKEIRANYDQVKSNIPEGNIRNELLGNWGTLSNLVNGIEQRIKKIEENPMQQTEGGFADSRINAVLRTPGNQKIFEAPKTPKSVFRSPTPRKPASAQKEQSPEISPANPSTVLTPSDMQSTPVVRKSGTPLAISRYSQMTMEDFYNVYLKPIFKDDFNTFLKRAILTGGDGYKDMTLINGTDQALQKFVAFVFNDPNNPKDRYAQDKLLVSVPLARFIGASELARLVNFMGHVMNEPVEQRRQRFLQLILDNDRGPSSLLMLMPDTSIVKQLAEQTNFVDNLALVPAYQSYSKPNDIKPPRYPGSKYEYTFDKDKPIEYNGALIPVPDRDKWIISVTFKEDAGMGNQKTLTYSSKLGLPSNYPPNYFIDLPRGNPQDLIPYELRSQNANKQLLLLPAPERSLALISKPTSLDTDESTPSTKAGSTQRLLTYEEPLAIMAKETDEMTRIERELVPYEKQDEDNDWEIGDIQYQYEFVDETGQENSRGAKITEESSEQWKTKKYTKKIPDGVMRLWLVENQVFLDIRLF